jgi:hypothetical protein
MSKPAAFSATYSDFKLVKTRKVAQLVFEVPLEAVDAALSVVGGMPDPGAERWFGIAPLKEEAAKAPKEKKHWRDMPAAQQAAIRCNEPIFRAFLSTKGYDAANNEEAAEAVRDWFGVKSRTEIAPEAWRELDGEYLAWKTVEGSSWHS